MNIMSLIIYGFMSLVTLVSSLFPVEAVKPLEETDFVPAVRFMVCSDTHINSENDPKLQRIEKAISLSYEIASQDETYNNLDAVLFAGDLTDGGTDEQFSAFNNAVKASVRDGTEILAIVANQHDSWVSSANSNKWIKEITGKDSDFNVNINGFHIIGISTTKMEKLKYGVEQRTWLEAQLMSAKLEDSEKPVFVCHHENLSNTIYGSEYWDADWFKDVIFRYSNVVHFSGHSHYPLNDPRSIWQGNITAVGTGSMSYLEFAVDGEEPVYPEGNDNTAQMWIIEASNDNIVHLRGYDVLNSDLLCEYYIFAKSGKETNAYSPYSQKARSSAPKFSDEANLTVTENGNKYTVSAPAAESTDGNPVFLYRVTVKDAGGNEVYSTYKLNNYWLVNQYKNISFDIEANEGYTVEILAENCYSMQSDKLIYKF